jgi:MFS superfamily sulfate permease-like transporter
MTRASSFTPFEPDASAQGWAGSLHTALNACAFSIPLSIGCVTIVFARHAPGLLPAAVLATLLGIALLQLSAIASNRPVVFSARVLESTTLAALVDTAAHRFVQWGLPDSPEVRVALIVSTIVGAAIVVFLLGLFKAARFVRFLPTPVFAGFNNAVAVGILIGQLGNLRNLLGQPAAQPSAVVGMAALVFACGIAIRRWLPRWPATATALGLGLLAGVALAFAGSAMVMVAPAGTALSLPVAHKARPCRCQSRTPTSRCSLRRRCRGSR